jgi:predicted O-methyltransferase YrrM
MNTLRAGLEKLLMSLREKNYELAQGLYQFEITGAKAEHLSLLVGDHVEILERFMSEETGFLSSDADLLLEIFQGKSDPMACGGRLRYTKNGDVSITQSHADELQMMTFLLQSFNIHHVLPRFQNHAIGHFYRTGKCTDSYGNPVMSGGWSITGPVGSTLFRIGSMPEVLNTLEIGLAYGISTMFICEAHRDHAGGMHVAIDPFQKSYFQNIGIRNVESAGLSGFLEFMELPDWLALPDLVKQGRKFDMVFIDGLHHLDAVLLDFFYGDLLLPPGGYMVFDDSSYPGVHQTIDYILAKKSYEEIERSFNRIAVLKKIKDEDRERFAYASNG